MSPDPATLKAILARLDPPPALLGVERAPGGLVNRVLFLRTDRGDVVLRTFAQADRWKPAKEQAVCDWMRALAIPAPRVLLTGDAEVAIPFAWSLSERIAGQPLADILPRLSEPETLASLGQLGDCLGRLHADPFPRFGDVHAAAAGLTVGPAPDLATGDGSTPPGPFETWAELHDAIVRARCAGMRGTPFADLVPPVVAFFAAQRHPIERPVVPRLLHLDLHPGNVLVRDGRVVGIVDVEEALVGHNEYDLMRTELGVLRGRPANWTATFMGAYTRHVPLDDGYEGRRRFYDASRSLAWIRSLTVTGDPHRQAAAARAHLLALIDGDD